MEIDGVPSYGWKRTYIETEVEKGSKLVNVFIDRTSQSYQEDDYAHIDLSVESARLLVVELIDAIATAEGNSNGN